MRSPRWAPLLVTSLSGSIILSAAVCVDAPPRVPQADTALAAKGAGAFQCTNPPSLTYKIPAYLNQTTQVGADCFAWQLFIALNWPASSARGQPDVDAAPSDFGAPGDYASVVWETYKGLSEVFLEGGAPPAPWSAPMPAADCTTARHEVHIGGIALKPSSRAFTDVGEFSPRDGVQAGPSGSHGRNWLADQSGDIVWYQAAINQTEFEYIVDGGLYSAAGQAARVAADAGIDPPTSATEIKAAWRRLLPGERIDRYLVTAACIPGPGGTAIPTTLGLVGLHILHKAANQPQWVWATFEQVDNAPPAGAADAGADGGFAFYSPSCNPATQPIIPAACLPADAGVVRQSCTPNQLPEYNLQSYLEDGGCPPYPVQVVRTNPIPSSNDNPVQSTNAAAQAMIAAQAGANSVLQYYQLVNVIWWDAFNDPNSGGPRPVPLSTTGAEHLGNGGTNVPVANTVLETFAQTDNCLDCHQLATIAAAPDGGASQWASNFSFIYGHAQWPAGAPQSRPEPGEGRGNRPAAGRLPAPRPPPKPVKPR